MRSGIEIYGRARGAPTRPDESADIDPTCEYGDMLAGIERTAAAIGRRIGVTVGAIRMGTVLGPHVPSPLGRVLRMPAVPFSVLADPPFAVVEDIEVARAFVAAAQRRLAEPVNVVANGAITALQAARRGRRIPVPLVGPDWRIARVVSGLLGAPIPDHVVETLHRGRLADNSRMGELLGFTPTATTVEVIDKLYAVADRRAHPGPAGGGVMSRRAPATRPRGASTLPGRAARSTGVPRSATRRRAACAPASVAPPRSASLARRRLGPRPDARRGADPARPAALEHGRSAAHDRLPARAGALIVVNARRYALAPVFTALALTASTGPAGALRRPSRRRPVGALARRLGGLLARPDEVAGALRAGELLVMRRPADVPPAPRRARRPPPDRRRRGDQARPSSRRPRRARRGAARRRIEIGPARAAGPHAAAGR